jgi:DNA polymerase III epsilon subunit-like protein
VVDTLVLARRKHPGGHNTLDDLCSQDFILQNAEVGLMTATKERVMKALMVITSHDQLGNTGRKTGFWLEELSTRPFALTASSRKTSTPSSTRAAMARCGISPKTSTPSS